MNMHTKIISLVAAVLIAAPLIAAAQTSTDQATIQQLLKQITMLQAQLANLQSYQPVAVESKPTNTPPLPTNLPPKPGLPPDDKPGDEGPTASITFDRDLYFGIRNNADVSNLQEFLTDQGFYANTISGNFFILTQGAVKKFQAAHGLRPTGYFGPLTRGIANEILAGIEAGSEGGSGVGVIPQPAIKPTTSGSLYIVPRSARLQVGESIAIKAYYQPKMSPCIQEAECLGNPAPQLVDALFTSSDPSVAIVKSIFPPCPPPLPGPPPGVLGNLIPPCPTAHSVYGISRGHAVITAVYTDGAKKYVATMTVVVLSSGSPLTLTAPNGGEVWAIGSTQKILWSTRDTVPTVMIHISDAVGATPLYLTDAPNTGSYTWVVPKMATGRYRIQIALGDGGPGKTDESDAPFSIVQ